MVLIFTVYSNGHDGGSIRHEQISDIVKRSAQEVIINPGISSPFRKQFFQTLIPSLISCIKITVFNNSSHRRLLFKSWNQKGLINKINVGRNYYLMKKAILRYNVKLVIVEDVIFGGQGVIIAAKESGIPVIALPHNIDSLTSDVYNYASYGKCMALEMEALSFANKVFAISQNDSWLHHQFDIKSLILSYYPTLKKEAYLLYIRSMRDQRPMQKRFLIPGSANNPKTKEGLIKLLNAISIQLLPEDIYFDVIGIETQSCQIPGLSNQIVFYGEVTHEKYLSLAINCTACVAYQEKGTGALTRVMDMLLAGIPVLGNYMALRGWMDLDGVYLFNEWNEFNDLLNKSFNNPKVPERQKKEENNFISSLYSLSATINN